MEAFSDLFAFMTGVPTMVGLLLTGLAVFLSSDWRLSLTALLIQYVLTGIALTRFIQSEVAIVKILAGVLAVFILYLTGRRIQELESSRHAEVRDPGSLGVHLGWSAGPLGLPLRFLAALLVALALVRLFNDPRMALAALPTLSVDGATVSPDMVFAAVWLGSMGVAGLVLSGDPLRVAPAVLTILTGFDLIYAGLEPSLAIVGLLGALTLLAAMSFSYLAMIRALRSAPAGASNEEVEA